VETLPGPYYVKIATAAVGAYGVWEVTSYGEYGLPVPISVEELDPAVLVEDLAVDVYFLNLQEGIENSLDTKIGCGTERA